VSRKYTTSDEELGSTVRRFHYITFVRPR